jgi:hypothetical protein
MIPQPIVNQQVAHVLSALDNEVQNAIATNAEGPKDYGPPAESDADPEPETGSSGAEEGISPISDEPYDEKA